MSIESDAAAQITSVYTKSLYLGAEVAVKVGGQVLKLAGKAVQELLNFIAKSIRQEGKNGRLLLINMLKRASKDGKTLSMIRINDTKRFDELTKELKSHGIMFSKARGKNCYDILFFADDAPRMNMIFEKLGINSVEKITDTKAEQITEKTDAPTGTPDYEQELPFDEDIKYYDSIDNLVDDYLKKEKERGGKESAVPSKDREEPVEKKDSQQQSKLEKETAKTGNNRKSQRELIKEKKAERAKKAEKQADAPAKAADTTKNLNLQEVKSK